MHALSCDKIQYFPGDEIHSQENVIRQQSYKTRLQLKKRYELDIQDSPGQNWTSISAKMRTFMYKLNLIKSRETFFGDVIFFHEGPSMSYDIVKSHNC